ncbi:MAG TPA: hypothetical protein DEG17_11445 [Cyanobacteria bacterium UBA11149]|nr:hypothetical protein [Cyanobacteria bacterium UBA11367]HBE60456.1 hypothetical protein [Cyanobacteria bacterium UBA11366]HBK62317.1 hypothetical protein [Cyanobacteria bacterium UBA11166]HBR74212.1 hypothetical protein [Cyanobacteria bacterium UBA11159]HBS71121.1 hypothetical protein [Cyanobacteria bacterium UBA11153]HBW89461.1 hypothetical protein [Cyanobacteria bacterium UBA11149]HCA95109.1 hypothetical protein [Cyanobacteria bacterium UBA9226]
MADTAALFEVLRHPIATELPPEDEGLIRAVDSSNEKVCSKRFSAEAPTTSLVRHEVLKITAK